MTSKTEAGDPTDVFPAIPMEYARAGAEWFSDSVHALADILHPFMAGVPHEPVAEFPDMHEEDEAASTGEATTPSGVEAQPDRGESQATEPETTGDNTAPVRTASDGAETSTGEQEEWPGDFRQFRERYEFVMSVESILDFDVEAVLTHVRSVADSMGERRTRNLVGFIADTATAAGNVFTSDPANPLDGLIDALEAMDVPFDENGNHTLDFVFTTEFVEWVSENPPTEAQKKRINDILDKKWEEQRASRSNRRLP